MNKKLLTNILSRFQLGIDIKKKFCKNLIREFSGSVASIPNQLGKNMNINLAAERTIFFDLQSTTPVDPRVLDAMLPYQTVRYGNPHSNSHEYGWEADNAVEMAREVIYTNLFN